MPLIAGARLGTYEIVAPLGSGGMGEVYRANDLRLGRQIALKVLPAGVAAHPDRLARFEREARTLAGLNHPNIVILYSVEDDHAVRFLTMELVDGQGLDTHVVAGGLPIARVLELGIALSDALSAAHEKGVVHRDLKPANVMLTREGRLKVLDFGLATFERTGSGLDASRAQTMTTPLTTEGQVAGTVPYMAPEQVRGKTVDARADLFALGIMLYELLSGRRPFGGDSFADVSSAILRDTPESLATVRADLPAELERIVGRCLEKNLSDRFQTALDVCNELRRVKRALEAGELKAAPRPVHQDVASIAVLPFVNRSASADDEYFSDGLADEMLHVLAKIQGLRVAARTSAFSFKGKDATIADIGRALNVATVLEGSVRKAGLRVRITCQLVKVSDGFHLWSETYDRTLDDIFEVQDDIAQSVVKELRTALLGETPDSTASGEVRAEVAKAMNGRGTHPEAHRLHLQARHLNDRRSRDDVARGIEYLKQALALDPESARAWVELGTAYSIEGGNGWVPPAEAYPRARAAVERALLLEPDLADAHAEMGRLHMVSDWDWKAAETSIGKAYSLAPSNVPCLRIYAALAYNQARYEEAAGYLRTALEQDPLSGPAYYNLALTLHAAGLHADAAAAYRKVLDLFPHRIAAHSGLSLTLLAQGLGEEALAEAEQEPHELLRLWVLAIIRHALGRTAESGDAARQLIATYADTGAYQIAQVCAARGEADEAFEWLERAFGQDDPGLVEVKADPLLRPLHGDPRWRAWVGRMGFDT